MNHRIALLAASAALLCAFAAPAHAQTDIARRPASAPRGYLDYFAAGVGSPGAQQLGTGFGARLMVRVAPATSPLGRMTVGGYVSRLAGRADGVDSWHYGSQLDAHVRGAGARVDPMFTLAAGAVRRDGQWIRRMTARRPVRYFSNVASTGYTLSPGAAVRAHVTRAVAVRGDVRRAFALDRDAREGTEFSVGISLPF